MDSLAAKPEKFNVCSRNAYDKVISNTPRNMSANSTNIVHKLFNREVSLKPRYHKVQKLDPVLMLYFFFFRLCFECILCVWPIKHAASTRDITSIFDL